MYEKVYGYTSDVVVFTDVDKELCVLLVKRGEEPYKGMWALPGGFVVKGETSEGVVKKKLKEETGVSGIYINELGMYDKLGRDPRGWVISNSFYSIISMDKLEGMYAGERTEEVKLVKLKDIEIYDVAFDHLDIIRDGYRKLEMDMSETLVAKEFLSEEFILSDLYDLLLRFNVVSMEKSNFFTKVKKLSFIEEVLEYNGESKTIRLNDGKTKRPVKVYRFKDEKVKSSIY